MSDEKLFPIQRERGAAPHPIRIPWSVAERAYSIYSAKYGRDQSLERLAERGGFGPGEMDEFLPGWRDEVSEITKLRTEVKRLEALLHSADTTPASGWASELAAARENVSGTAALLSEAQAEVDRVTLALNNIIRRAHVEEPEGQTIRELNQSVRVLRDELHEQRIRAQNSDAYRDALQRVVARADKYGRKGGGQFLGTSGRVDCPECHWPVDHSPECEWGKRLAEARALLPQPEGKTT